MANSTTFKLLPLFLIVFFNSGLSQVVLPNPQSKLASKNILVLDGPSTSHAAARNATTTMLTALKDKMGFQMVLGDPNDVSDSYLQAFDIIIFNYYLKSETASVEFKSAIQKWVESGGKGYVGYHTSGANEEGEWDWYRDYVTSMRYFLHSSQAQQGTIYRTDTAEILTNPIMQDLPESFTGVDEWYEFDFGITFKDAKVMYFLDEGTLTNPLEKPMNPHPMAWYREDSVKSRYFYTGIIHTTEGVESDFFQSLILRALEWVAGYEGKPGCPNPAFVEYDETRTSDDSSLCVTLGINDQASTRGDFIHIFQDHKMVSVNVAHSGNYRVQFHHISGKQILAENFYNRKSMTISTQGLKPGVYTIQVTRKGKPVGHRNIVIP